MSAKRIFDVVIASFLLVLFAPLLIVISLLVRLDSPGPILFKQRRLGRNRMPFVILKFRTMHNGAEHFGCQTQRGDERITRIGRFLRRPYLDELPQLWNIVKGEMSLVGPRPLSPELVRQIETEIPDQGERFTLLPGLTGPTQVVGRMEVLSGGPRQAFLLDLAYTKNRTLFLDITLLAKTAFTICKMKGI